MMHTGIVVRIGFDLQHDAHGQVIHVVGEPREVTYR